MVRTERLERFERRRPTLTLVNAAAFAVYTVLACRAVGRGGLSPSDWRGPSNAAMAVVVWAVWGLVALGHTFLTTQALTWTREERALLADELVRRQRLVAALAALGVLLLGVLVQCLGPLGLWQLPSWWPMATLSGGILAAAATFALLDRRADG